MSTVTDTFRTDRPLLSSRARTVCYVVSLLGAGTFLYGVVAGDAVRVWEALLVNFLFWSGIAQAGVVLSVLLQVTAARWGRPLKRVAEATAAFMPVAFLVLLVLFLGQSVVLPWVEEPVEARQAWLNVPFLVARQGLGFLLLSGLSLLYVYFSVRPDIGMLRESGTVSLGNVAQRWIGGWRGLSAERAFSQRWQNRLAPMILIVYAYVFSLQAFDFVMSLDPQWYSTLVGGYFFIGNLYAGVAFLAVVAVWARTRLNLQTYIGTGQLHDLGRLLLGFCMLWTYLFWTQYLVIWYGDLPEETAFVARRTAEAPWAALAWIVFLGCFLIPFVTLLSREVKRRPRGLLTIALIVLVGMWLERFILVSPSLWEGELLPLGVIELLLTGGFLASFTICYTTFLQAVPILPLADPLFGTAEGRSQDTA